MLSRIFVGLREQFGKGVPRPGLQSTLEETSFQKHTTKAAPNDRRKRAADEFIRQDLISGTWN